MEPERRKCMRTCTHQSSHAQHQHTLTSTTIAAGAEKEGLISPTAQSSVTTTRYTVVAMHAPDSRGLGFKVYNNNPQQ